MKGRRFYLMGLLALAAVLLVGLACAPPAAPAPTPAAKGAAPAATPAAKAEVPETPTLKVSDIVASAVLPIHMADKLGYLKDEGLTVEYSVMRGAEALPLVQAGRLHLANSAFSGLFDGREAGFDFMAAAPNTAMNAKPPDQYATLVLKGSGMKRWKDLEGKKVSVPYIRGIDWLVMRELVKKDGGDPEKISFVELGFSAMPDALVAKQVDAISTIEPFVTVLVQSGKADLIGYYMQEALPGADVSHYMGSEKWIKENPITLKKFNRAIRKAVDYIAANPAEARKFMAEFTKTDPAIADKMVLPQFLKVASAKSLQQTADFMYGAGLLKQKHDASKYVYEAAAKE